ncbi:MAG: Ig-like domain-containing domain [Pseudoflavonifractor sp.]|nr:Ig-like domain-containing domain [Alloprevotella sp.]MCM1116283.1 Ig-like domain-containing domain [Pseudoflavonifractor sp.]
MTSNPAPRPTRLSAMAILPLAVMLLCALAAGCASMGRPEGGPKDELPPVFLQGDPEPGALNVKSTRFRLRFDENIQLKDIQQNVIVSPAQKRQPAITGNGHIVTVELKDSLIDSTTYTIDFGSAIVDLNEGNILDGFSYAFSTGPTIDTLCISGMVFEAANLEPAQGMIVGAYRADAPDSAITSMPLQRVTRTNQYGQFTLRNLAPGSYRLYALGDANSDYHWDRSENIAFLTEAVAPRAEEITVTDTIATADGRDSVSTHPGVLYLPNDLILTWFNENYRPSYITKYERTDTARLTLQFNAPMDSTAEIAVVAPEGPLAHLDRAPLAQWGVADISAGRDTMDIWVSNRDIISRDSLFISVRYLKTDTADNLTWGTDTLKMFLKKGARTKADGLPGKKGKKAEAKADTLPPKAPTMRISLQSNTQQLNQPLRLKIDRPLADIDTLKASLEMKAEGDTVWTPVKGFHLTLPAERKLLELQGSHVDWESGASYRLTVDSAAMTGIYGEALEPFSSEFKARQRDEYSSIVLDISGLEGKAAIAQLLNASDEPVAEAAVGRDGKATFAYLEPATYYARLFIDANDNGKYDTGSLLDSIQPEEVAYYPKKIPLKKNWDLQQSWNIYDTPLDMQKPSDIKKNKPKKKEGEADDSEEEEEIEYDEFGRPINAGEYRNPFGASQSSSSGRRGSSRGGMQRGGFRNNTSGGQIR